IYNRPASIGSAFSLTTAIKSNTTDNLYINRALVYGQSGKLSTIAACQNTGNVARGYNGNTFFSGDIAEIVVYTRTLSPSEQQSVEAYLDNKYAITAPT